MAQPQPPNLPSPATPVAAHQAPQTAVPKQPPQTQFTAPLVPPATPPTAHPTQTPLPVAHPAQVTSDTSYRAPHPPHQGSHHPAHLTGPWPLAPVSFPGSGSSTAGFAGQPARGVDITMRTITREIQETRHENQDTRRELQDIKRDLQDMKQGAAGLVETLTATMEQRPLLAQQVAAQGEQMTALAQQNQHIYEMVVNTYDIVHRMVYIFTGGQPSESLDDTGAHQPDPYDAAPPAQAPPTAVIDHTPHNDSQ
jgi:hypothetical protein